MRGEHVYFLGVIRGSLGSSPHARGTPARSTLLQTGDGIIPACAGNTIQWRMLVTLTRDHPRMRGEHTLADSASTVDWGSSPHARGTPLRRSDRDKALGIIPACAGNTSTLTTYFTSAWDHPRMRGEHCGYLSDVHPSLGSSPHARGTPGCSIPVDDAVGIIPACAGNTYLRRFA